MDDYESVFIPHLSNPNHLALRRYAAWWFQGRQAAFPAAAMGHLDAISQDLRRRMLDPDRAPWPWDLADPVTLDLYLQWALDNGFVNSAPAMA